jgi:hypothetical protein
MKIDRHNYEEFFLLYVDHELTAEQKKSVEQFIQENPDLARELELFRQTSLVSDDAIVFEDKELLMKKENGSFISINNYEEYLVAYIDNELTTAERKEFEKFVALHPAVKEELSVFLQTKLQPETETVFANKEILYRKEEKVRVITMQWRKIAVAAAIILAIGITTFTVLTRNTIVHVEVAKTDNKQNDQKTNTEVKTDKDIKKEKQNVSAAIENNDAVALTKKITDKEIITPVQKIREEKIQKKSVVPPAAVNNDVIAKSNAPVKNIDVTTINNNIEKKIIDNSVPDKKETGALNNTAAVNNTTAKQNINSNPVTNNSDKPYNTIETVPEKQKDIEPVFVSNNESSNKKTRGFFRKATRIFEKRTNISAADDDDKILIGVLAVKLK